MGSARTIRCSIWTLPFDKIRFSQLNTASAGIVTHCCFFSARTEEMPEVIVLDHVLIALNFSAKLCVFAFQIRCAEFAANGFVFRKLLLQAGDFFLELCNQPVSASRVFCSLDSFFSAATYFFAAIASDSYSERSNITLEDSGTVFASIFSMAATSTC